ncbi:hypothetical protein D3C87_1882500 [compost metagenome]
MSGSDQCAVADIIGKRDRLADQRAIWIGQADFEKPFLELWCGWPLQSLAAIDGIVMR